MDRRELLATGGVSLIAIAGCLGTYEVARQSGLMPKGDDSGSGSDSDSDEGGPELSDDADDPLADTSESEDDSPLEDNENSENESKPVPKDNESNDSDESYEPDDGPLLDDVNETVSNETKRSGTNDTDESLVDEPEANRSDENETDGNESGEVPDDRPEDPAEHVTWIETDHEIFETEYGDSEVIILGEIRNETGYDLSYLRVGGQGYLDGELITENSIEIAGLATGDTLTIEIPLYVEPEAIDEYRYGVWEAEYVEE
ncbi:hypothetical protein [Saliphagus infecundisoli]|uniref:DUF4352 domain-containing protein n=1 Tax=Saliphagus infecundisoli TaxID=1849069 RepID=A0ABD5QHN8_9EURY|nr:hypothetical protein [Saliphagus infecundisoli]